jgi:hypothetical protein
VPQRASYPLFWWIAPDGQRLLTHWPPYDSTRTWGGYAEASELLRLAGEGWDAFRLQHVGDRNTSEVFAARVDYIAQTVARYEALGDDYPVSHILLLGTGWDNWTITDDLSRFIARYSDKQDGSIRLVDARYDEFFAAVEQELSDRHLTLPEQRGSFGICWEEWAAHLAGYGAEFRRAERLMPRIEASLTMAALATGHGSDAPAAPVPPLYANAEATLGAGYRALLRFAEHDMGGCNLATAAIAAGNRAAAATRALTIAHTLAAPAHIALGQDEDGESLSPWRTVGEPHRDVMAAPMELAWRGGTVVLDPLRSAITALRDHAGVAWVPTQAANGQGCGLGELVHTRYQGDGPFRDVLPEALPGDPQQRVDAALQRKGPGGIEVQLQGRRWGMDYVAHWRLHAASDTLDVTYHLTGGWDAAPQSVQVAFPLALAEDDAPVRYHHDSVGAIVTAGFDAQGGEELPGAYLCRRPHRASDGFQRAARDCAAQPRCPPGDVWASGRDRRRPHYNGSHVRAADESDAQRPPGAARWARLLDITLPPDPGTHVVRSLARPTPRPGIRRAALSMAFRGRCGAAGPPSAGARV